MGVSVNVRRQNRQTEGKSVSLTGTSVHVKINSMSGRGSGVNSYNREGTLSGEAEDWMQCSEAPEGTGPVVEIFCPRKCLPRLMEG